jgi:hypothetical protein
MQIATYSPSGQVDIAADLGVVPPPLPEIVTVRQLVESAPAVPPELVEGVLHQTMQDGARGHVEIEQVVVSDRPGDQRGQRVGMAEAAVV